MRQESNLLGSLISLYSINILTYLQTLMIIVVKKNLMKKSKVKDGQVLAIFFDSS